MYTRIVVGTDGSATATLAVEHAAALARAFGAELHLVSAYKNPSVILAATPEAMVAVDDTEWREAMQADAEASLAALTERLADSGIEVTAHAAGGDPAKVIVEMATRLSADLLVVGNKGMKGRRRLLGSVPNTVAHQAPCSVLIVETV
jgi:nucleotide-binding universal stress UspA family protein